MTAAPDRLYGLLPAAHRVRDVDRGQPLRALLGVLEEQLLVLDDDIASLYDNWFIETCAEWVVPYIGDLVGARDLLPSEAAGFTRRGIVANTLAYRRRKGTAVVLERLASDVCGWPAKAVEFFQRLAVTTSVNHVRPTSLAIADLRIAAVPELSGTVFERATHTADVRHIDNGRGQYNLANVGLFLWRLQSYPMVRSTARAVTAEAGRFTFNPVGIDAPLFNRRRTGADLTHAVGEVDVPGPLRRRPLYDELMVRQNDAVSAGQGDSGYLGSDPVFEVWVGGTKMALGQLAICDLADWRPPPMGAQVAVDPVLGRLTVAAPAPAPTLEVSYSYGFAADVGGGPYDRRDSVAQVITGAVDWQVGVSATSARDPQLKPSLEEAVVAWNALAPLAAGQTRTGVIVIVDNGSYPAPTTPIDIGEGCHLFVVAADWLDGEAPGGRVNGRLAPVGRRPHVQGDWAVHGAAGGDSVDAGGLALDGLLVEGAVVVTPGNLATLRLAHCTLVPRREAATLTVASGGAGMDNHGLQVVLQRCICGPVNLAGATVEVTDSIVAGPAVAAGSDVAALAVAAGAAEFVNSTVFGVTAVRTIEASGTIFTGDVRAERRQVGCVRFCFLPLSSSVPRRFRCQPESGAVNDVAPTFVATAYGQPGFAQLSMSCPAEVAAGGPDEAEMGAFSFLSQPQRLKNLRASLDDYLRVGLEAGVLFVT